jgi:hypothetical protein
VNGLQKLSSQLAGAATQGKAMDAPADAKPASTGAPPQTTNSQPQTSDPKPPAPTRQ